MVDQAVVEKAAEFAWERLATFGALGIITGWLLLERFIVGRQDRAARHALATALANNTMMTDHLTDKIEDLSKAIWQFIITGGGRRPPSPMPSRERAKETTERLKPPYPHKEEP